MNAEWPADKVVSRPASKNNGNEQKADRLCGRPFFVTNKTFFPMELFYIR